MNKIHKVIWSRCSNTFIVVSELASSRSGGSSTRRGRRAARSGLTSSLTALAAGVALAFGLSVSALAQPVSMPGGSVLTVGPGDPDLVNGDVANSAYGNALQIGAGVETMRINGGSFAIVPTAPDDTRADTNPYAAIWIDTIAGDEVFLENDVTINVQGDNLHGIYLADFYNWLSSSGTEITATGTGTTGMLVAGTASIRGGEIKVSGDYAKGLSVQGGAGNIANEVILDVSGSGVIGIDVNDGGLSVMGVVDPSEPLSMDLPSPAVASSDVGLSS